ncbi:MAG: M20/M25/M40 family metallo-hydrolase, partial [Acidimicrobiales bacterium]
MPDQLTGEVTELLQVLIRNQCVNDGSVESGHEARSADILTNVLEGPGVDIERYEPEPGRTSVVARIEGSNRAAPSLLLMGHTDVVPVSPDRWRHDPFGGELIDGEVWGRGAVDMLNLTASMAVATRKLADEGFRPEGTLIYLGVADEEALGTHGAQWLTENVPEMVSADYVLTESGGMPTETPGGMKLPLIVAEKGSFWCTLRVTGTPGHGSQSYKVDNALVKAAEVVRRVSSHRPQTRIHETWTGFLAGIGFPEEMTAPLSDPDTFLEALDAYPDAMARLFHACTHTSVNPTIIRGGSKVNVVPDAVEIDLDIRIVPTETEEDVRKMLEEAIGDLADSVELTVMSSEPPSASPTDTPLYESLQRLV